MTEDGVDLVLEDLSDDEVMAVLGGISTFQMQALAAGAIPKVNAAGSAMRKLAKQNPEPVREAFIEHSDVFRVANMPEEMLDHLDLEVRDGKLFEPDDEDGWTEVEIE